jgi:hypothetical protein
LDGRLISGCHHFDVLSQRSYVARHAPAAVERVRAMVAGEQHCCAFLDFDVQEQSDSTVVTITAPENAIRPASCGK